MKDPDEGRMELLKKRIPLADIKLGKAYVIHARNGGVGVAVLEKDGTIGYQLRREKFGNVFLFVECDWERGMFGTAIPLQTIDEEPPAGDAERLEWLAQQEQKYEAITKAAWNTVLGYRKHNV